MVNKRNSKIKLIIIDYYGVMTKGSYKETCQWLEKKYKKKYGYTYKYLYDIVYYKWFCSAAIRKITERESFEGPIKDLGLNETWKELRTKHLSFQKANKPVLNLCRELQKQGYAIFLLSKNTPWQFNYAFTKTHMRWYFKHYLNTYDLGYAKDSPKTIRYILKRFKVKPHEVVMVDDQDFNLVEPEKIGVKTILYKNFHDFKKKLLNILFKNN